MTDTVVHHDMMGRAISSLETDGWSRPKRPHCRSLQRPYLTTDRETSYRNGLPATINIHQDKDLRREMAASRCQNDIKSRWDNKLEMGARKKIAYWGASKA